ncbi:MAG: hypothetical protein ACRDI1_08205, partial [Actinomycetota bacterium]
SVTGSKPIDLLSGLGEELIRLPAGLPPGPPPKDRLDGASCPHRARVAQLPVAFTCEAHSIPGLAHPDTPAIAVLGHLLWIGYLNPEARRIGAYGIDVQTLPERGLFWISSRRDPVPAGTYRAFSEGLARFREGRWEGPRAEEGMLAALRVTDPVDSPALAARRAWLGRFTGHTTGLWNEFRKRLLEVTDADLQRVADQYLTAGARATLIGPSMLQEMGEESRMFDEVEEI